MPNSDLKVLGEKVRTERKLAGLTQEQLAERCHVSTKHKGNIAAADGEKLHLRHGLSSPLENDSCDLHCHDFQHSAAGHQKEPNLPCPLRFGDGRCNGG